MVAGHNRAFAVQFFGQVADYHMSWKSAYSQLEVHSDFVHYIELFGLVKAERVFKQHIARLRDEFIARRQNVHLHRLDAILHKLLPDLASVADRFVTQCVDDDYYNNYYYCHYSVLTFIIIIIIINFIRSCQMQLDNKKR